MIDIENVKRQAAEAVMDAVDGFKHRMETIEKGVTDAIKTKAVLLKEPVTQTFATIDLNPGYGVAEDAMLEVGGIDIDMKYCGMRRAQVIDGGKIKPGKYAVIVSFIPIEDVK